MKTGDIMPPSVVKAVRNIVEQPYRYLTVEGGVYDRPFWQRFHHRAEFKTAAAVAGAAAFGLQGVFHLNAWPVAEFLLGSVYGYMSARSNANMFNYFLMPLKFGMSQIIDTQPEPRMVTSPDNLQKVMTERESARQRLNLNFRSAAMGVISPTAIFTAFNYMEIHSRHPTGILMVDIPVGLATFMSGVSLSFGMHALSQNLSTITRMGRILSGEYVLLSEPPAKQEEKVYSGAPEMHPAPAGA